MESIPNTGHDSSPAPFDTDGGIFVFRHQTQGRKNKWIFGLVFSLLALLGLTALLIHLWSGLPWWGVVLVAIPSIIAALIAFGCLAEVRRRPGLHLDGFRIARGKMEMGAFMAAFKDPTDTTLDSPRELVLIEWKPARKQPESLISIKWHVTSWDNPSQSDIGEWRVDKLSIRAQKPFFYGVYNFTNANQYAVLIREKFMVYPAGISAQNGARLIKQLRAAADLFKDLPVLSGITLEFQVKAPTGNKAMAAAFGAIGLLVSAASDEKKKRSLQEQLKAGAFLGGTLDEEFLSIVQDLHAGLSVG